MKVIPTHRPITVPLPTSIADRLTQFADQLERGGPVTATQIERHETPDGPMHTATKVQLWPSKKRRKSSS